MFGSKNKKFDWNENTAPKLKDLSLNIEVNLYTKENKETSYPETNTLFTFNIKENLLTTSDNKRKEILSEIQDKFEEVYSKLEKAVLNSDKLSDEFHKNKE